MVLISHLLIQPRSGLKSPLDTIYRTNCAIAGSQQRLDLRLRNKFLG